MAAGREKTYQKDNLNIHWKPDVCIHAGECVKRLPEVYKPNDRPWIQPENASVEALKSQIDACPSGALSYSEPDSEADVEMPVTRVEVLKDGPVLVHGTIALDIPGEPSATKEKVTAFCRCGASANKPYCDGAHRKIEFKG